jgi:hypothetical protein
MNVDRTVSMLMIVVAPLSAGFVCLSWVRHTRPPEPSWSEDSHYDGPAYSPSRRRHRTPTSLLAGPYGLNEHRHSCSSSPPARFFWMRDVDAARRRGGFIFPGGRTPARQLEISWRE